jgi:hypothetical protein
MPLEIVLNQGELEKQEITSSYKPKEDKRVRGMNSTIVHEPGPEIQSPILEVFRKDGAE